MRSPLLTALFVSSLLRAANNPNLPIIDISGQTERQTIIAQGTEQGYQDHPTTTLLADGKTMFCVRSINHGGAAGPTALSDDDGKTWTRLDDILPEGFKTHQNCPSIYRMTDPGLHQVCARQREEQRR